MKNSFASLVDRIEHDLTGDGLTAIDPWEISPVTRWNSNKLSNCTDWNLEVGFDLSGFGGQAFGPYGPRFFGGL